MWYWQLMSISYGNNKCMEQDGYCDTVEKCFKRIGDNTWRLYADDGFAYISLTNSSSHSFMFPIVKRNV